jgi:putative multiple sugar transport system substrate-binding protein
MSKKIWYSLMAMLVIAATVLSACGAPAAAPTEQATELAVGIVLPTKDEPRWIQDDLQEALTKAGYDVEILFSQGDLPKKSHVESLITKGQSPHFDSQDGAVPLSADALASRVSSHFV